MKKIAITFSILLAFALITARMWVLPLLPNDWLFSLAKKDWINAADLGLIAHALYGKGERQLARDTWLREIEAKGSPYLSLSSYFDIGNAYFEEGLESQDTKDQIRILLQAKDAYEHSLKFGDDKEAKANLEAVTNLLEKLQQKEDEEKKDQSAERDKHQSQQNQTGSGANSKDGSPQSGSGSQTGTGSTGTGSQSPQTGSGSGEEEKKEWKTGFTNSGKTQSIGRDFGTGTGESLSPSERQQLDATRERILELQKQRGNYTRPDGTKAPDLHGSLFEEFLKSDPMFQNLENPEGGKDW